MDGDVDAIRRGEIEARGPGRLVESTAAVEMALTERFGNGAISGRIQARTVTVTS